MHTCSVSIAHVLCSPLPLLLQDTGGRAAVKAVLVKSSSSGSWQPLKNSFGANWETGSSPTPPLDFKMVCDDGEEVSWWCCLVLQLNCIARAGS